MYKRWVETYQHNEYKEYKENNKEFGKLPDCFLTGHVELGERIVADKYTKNYCKNVLEFGGGSGAVSQIIQRNLENPYNHVVIQPSEGGMFGGINALKKNKDSCNAKYTIIDHILEEGEENEILSKVSQPFDCIVADCEGCLNEEYDKNPKLFNNIKYIQVERDDGNKYDTLFDKLNMKLLDGDGYGCNERCRTEVWQKL